MIARNWANQFVTAFCVQCLQLLQAVTTQILLPPRAPLALCNLMIALQASGAFVFRKSSFLLSDKIYAGDGCILWRCKGAPPLLRDGGVLKTVVVACFRTVPKITHVTFFDGVCSNTTFSDRLT